MDIRIINSEGKIINASRLHIVTRNVYLLGLTEDMKNEILIERGKSKEEVRGYLDGIKEALKVGQEEGVQSILIDLEGKEYNFKTPEEKICSKCEGCVDYRCLEGE